MPRKKIPLTLIHNDTAGGARHSRAALVDLLSRAGYKVEYFPYKRCDIAAALERPAELVAAAGGDGTVAKVAAEARPDGCPIAILPVGTANNIARSLGIEEPLEELVAGWRTGAVRPFYPIDASGPWGRRRVIEGLGFGAVEDAIADRPDKSNRAAARQSYADAVGSSVPEFLELRLEGETIKERFALLEICTIPFVGPNLLLAAGADPHDRKFEICFVRDTSDEREALAEWLAEPDNPSPAPVAMRVVERATIVGKFRRLRIDGGVKATEPERDWDYTRPITLTAASEPLPFLVPG